jgi:hypothetical protein
VRVSWIAVRPVTAWTGAEERRSDATSTPKFRICGRLERKISPTGRFATLFGMAFD